MKTLNKKSISLTLGAVAIGASSLASVNAQANPFEMKTMSAGYQIVSAEGKCGGDMKKKEGKCGEGKCGGDMKKAKKEGKCGEGKCGGDMKKAKKEGKCGEGKCGGDKKKAKKEGKCGEGKCGSHK